jgi:hypothetical protein
MGDLGDKVRYRLWLEIRWRQGQRASSPAFRGWGIMDIVNVTFSIVG